MDIASKLNPELAVVRMIVEAILASLAGIVLLIAFIVSRRWHRSRYFQKLNERTFALCSQWDEIVKGTVPVRSWRLNRFDCEIVESILLDKIETASREELQPLLRCLRSTGLLDLRIRQARTSTGWKQRAALVALGRTRAEEAVPALAEALDHPSQETRIAAVRGLGRSGLPIAALPVLERLVDGSLGVPEHAIQSALTTCCQEMPSILCRFLQRATGSARQVIARVLAEVAGPELEEELLVLATEENPELRASAVRALGKSQPSLALPLLASLVSDKVWFVRLRAVMALANINDPASIRPLLRAVCDSNRYVRQRAAWALTRVDSDLEHVLELVVETNDDYALQAFISELERSGNIAHVVNALQTKSRSGAASKILLQALAISRVQITQAAKTSAKAAAAQ
jgi:HEAT repeat protein